MSRVTCCSLDGTRRAHLDAFAKERNMSVQDLVGTIIEEWLETQYALQSRNITKEGDENG